MNTFFRFFYEFISIFFDALVAIFKGIYQGLVKMFNFADYLQIINTYKETFQGPEWFFVGLAIFVLVLIVVGILLLIIFAIRRFFRTHSRRLNQEELLEEISDLNMQVRDLMREKDEIMAMKVSQLGLSPDDTDQDVDDSGNKKKDDKKEEGKDGEEGEEEEDTFTTTSRFPKLSRIDYEMRNFKSKNYGNSFTLEELIDNLRCFSAGKLKLYYDFDLLRPFLCGLACGRLIILQGISGTGKTSLAYAWGKFVKNDSCVASVQPSWKDKTEIVGYFNEFTKKFNESEVLAELYKAKFDDNVHTIILDEMNIARVEYYFAEFLSILEMPSKDEWIIELVPNMWPDDPAKIDHGKILLPGNLWYIGTINNDDSTFMVSDKVYDRAMPIDINSKVLPFKCRDQEAMEINASYLESIFAEAREKHTISAEGMEKVQVFDDYVTAHFRIAFGNRIMKQLNIFVGVYIGLGGEEFRGIDYFIARKILRKFDQLNVSFIRDELDPFISFLNKEFGKGVMKECIQSVEIIKKSI